MAFARLGSPRGRKARILRQRMETSDATNVSNPLGVLLYFQNLIRHLTRWHLHLYHIASLMPDKRLA